MAARTTVIKARMAEGRIKRGRERPTNQTRANPLRVVSPEKRMFPLGGQDNLNFPRQPGEDVHRCISITPLNRIRYERQIQTLTTTKLADVTDERPLAAFSFLRVVSCRIASRRGRVVNISNRKLFELEFARSLHNERMYGTMRPRKKPAIYN